MSYIGENEYMSFRDGCCESIPGTDFGSSAAARFGRVLAGLYRRFSVACNGFGHNHILYALSSGLAECGRDVYLCENTDMPSFRFGYPMLSADCGIYVSGDLKISFFGKKGFPVSDEELCMIMNSSPAEARDKKGRIYSATSFRAVYVSNIADSAENVPFPIPAGISCGSRAVRSLWQEFFSGEDDSLVFQISDDGSRVNAYSTEAGFISYEKLILAYASSLSEKGQAVYLPDSFHYAADFSGNGSTLDIVRFPSDKEAPDEAVSQRFLADPLYMCVQLAKDRGDFIRRVKKLPQLACAKREVTVRDTENIPVGKAFSHRAGRVLVSRSGKNSVTLLSQAHTMEAAAELCSMWTEKLRRISSCGREK